MSDGMEENTAWMPSQEEMHIGHDMACPYPNRVYMEGGRCVFCETARLARDNEHVNLRRRVAALPHAPACPGDEHCWCPIHQVLGMLNRGSDEDA